MLMMILMTHNRVRMISPVITTIGANKQINSEINVVLMSFSRADNNNLGSAPSTMEGPPINKELNITLLNLIT